MKEKLLEALVEKEDLPPLPEVLIKLDSAIRGDNYNLGYIANLIMTDPALAGKVLKVANSAYYGGGRKEVTSIKLAMSRLGLNTLRQIIYSIELPRIFSRSSIIDRLDFWKHTLSVALLSVLILQKLNKSSDMIDQAYLAGLMHDVGIMVFCNLIPDEYKAFLDKAVAIKKPLQEQERRAFGIDHAELGSVFIKTWWPVDQDIIASVAKHHSSFRNKSGEITLPCLINIANRICNQTGTNNGVLPQEVVKVENLWNRLELSDADATEILDSLKGSVVGAAYMISS